MPPNESSSNNQANATSDAAVDGILSIVRHDLAGVRDLLPLADASPARYPCLLDSAARGGERARYDILFAFPQQALVKSADGCVRDSHGNERGESFLDALEADWRSARGDALAAAGDRERLPFHGGWVLFLAYEIAAEVEPTLVIAPAPATAPVALALRCPAAIVVDHALGVTTCVAETAHADRLAQMLSDLSRSHRDVAALSPARIDEDDPLAFIEGVAAVHEYLRAGVVFQVNLSRAWQARFDVVPSPVSLYAALRLANPAPFAGLLQWQGWSIASSSPERLVEVRGGLVQTRPIAGTRPRLAGDDDAARARELAGHVKERAEHIMLIDLSRNDLGRVCVPGTMFVDELMAVESFTHVHHIVSNVRGRLRPGVTPAQVIRAVFPGGTITGAPKVRTMQVIAELERCPRSAYTGALGYLNRNGDMDLSILIRTLELGAGAVCFRAGAGIVADSIAARELEETRAKARGLLRALGARE